MTMIVTSHTGPGTLSAMDIALTVQFPRRKELLAAALLLLPGI